MSVAAIERPVETSLRYWLLRWSEERTATPARKAADESRIHKYVLPNIQKKTVHRLTSDNIQDWMDNLRGQGVGVPTVHASLLALRGGLELARANGVIADNPARGLSVEGVTTIREPEVDETFTDAQLAAVLEHIDPHFRAMVHLAAETGAKWEECIALRSTDVFLDKNMVAIGRARLTEAMGRVTESEARPSEVRLLEISAALTKDLRRHLELTKDWRHGDFQWVFLTVRDHVHPLRPNFNIWTWRPALRKAGLDDRKYTFHSLRHTAAHRMIVKDGWEVERVSKALGHQSVLTTRRTYRQFLLERERLEKKRKRK